MCYKIISEKIETESRSLGQYIGKTVNRENCFITLQQNYQQISEGGRHYRKKICKNKMEILKTIFKVYFTNEWKGDMGKEKRENDWESEEKKNKKNQFKYFKALIKNVTWNVWNLNTDSTG